ncbi:hypothetical protein CesoFtcFv8_017492 [Champsocephalus esox]|uniref:Uncharacterized protein n=1 Tax=Champsocephalus esox TaxID=159716 RepID=A0AAN8GQB5_9TELE|nr:hypothetical protein CesoFtcFv8_017492 [Champsocephalus esox]
MNRSPVSLCHGTRVGQTLVSRICSVFPDGEGNGWLEWGGVAGAQRCQAVMWIISDSIRVLLPSSSSLPLLLPACCGSLQRAFNWESFDSAGCEA